VARTAGQGLVEYALILMLIALVVIGSVSLFGNQVSSTFTEVNCRLDGGTYHEDSGMGHSNRCDMPHGGGGGHP
jgi:pilus assembly protein Flp/PilA